MLQWLLGAPAYAHEGGAPGHHVPQWWEWTLEPDILFASAVIIGLYVWWCYRLKAQPNYRQHPFPRTQFAWFVAGLLAMYAAIASPIDPIGEDFLFTVHMLQHNIFVYLVPLGLLWGLPAWMLEPIFEHPTWQSILRVMFKPVVTFALFNILYTIWHVPILYELALQNRTVHNLEHLTFIVTALLMWWPLLSPLPTWRLNYPLQMLYIFGLGVGQLPVFLFVGFSPRVLYPTYEFAPRITSMSAIADQQVGAVLMQSLSAVVLTTALATTFYKWNKSDQAADELAAATSERLQGVELIETKAI